jgi:hypothetical protein
LSPQFRVRLPKTIRRALLAVILLYAASESFANEFRNPLDVARHR